MLNIINFMKKLYQQIIESKRGFILKVDKTPHEPAWTRIYAIEREWTQLNANERNWTRMDAIERKWTRLC